MASYYCELSGEAVTNDDAVVVTPSGHLCSKRLLLKKLAENGGVDPFSATGGGDDEVPLSEDQLIAISKLPSLVPPRPPKATTFPNLLKAVSEEYDALVLELLDTRKALEETRRELSQALYQNDAATRVVARIAAERDAARAQLEEWNAGGGGAAAAAASDKRAPPSGGSDGPPSKKPRTEAEEEQDLPLMNDIPASDFEQLQSTWEELHGSRKARQKEAAAKAPTKEQLVEFGAPEHRSTQSWHKTSCKGVTAMRASNSNSADGGSNFVVTAGTDKQLVLYNPETQTVVHSVAVSGGKALTCADVSARYFVAGTAQGLVKAFRVDTGAALETTGGEAASGGGAGVVDVRIHPDDVHVLAASGSGRITMYRIVPDDSDSLLAVAVLKPETESRYTCAALHPDGFLYAAGNEFGDVHLWDLKSKNVASTLACPGSDGNVSVVAICVSNNGYHVAAAYSDAKVRVWDLRKQKLVAALNENSNEEEAAASALLETVECVDFDDSGKYLAYGGTGGIRITTIKEWGVTASYDDSDADDSGSSKKKAAKKHPVSNVAWVGASGIVATSKKHREVEFYGPIGNKKGDE